MTSTQTKSMTINRYEFDYRVMQHADGSANSPKMPIESYSTDEGAAVGAWVLPEAGQQEGVRRSGRELTPNARNAKLSASWEASLSALAGVVLVSLCTIQMPGNVVQYMIGLRKL